MLLALFARRTYCWFMFRFFASQGSQIFFRTATFRMIEFPAFTVAWGYFFSVQEFVLPCVELHEAPICLYLQPVKVLLNDNITIWCINKSLTKP